MNLFERNYLDGLTEREQEEYSDIIKQENAKANNRKFGRIALLSKYPPAARHYFSLFPNNHLDIYELKTAVNVDQTNEKFIDLVSDSSSTERDILRYINHTPAFHIIGSILRGCSYRLGHHNAYLFPEFPLGTSYQADYLIVGNKSGGYEFVFVELEAPNGSITTNNGELGTTFRKGIAQVNNWNRWLQENYGSLSEYFEKHIKHGDTLPREFVKYDSSRIHFVVVAGMRKDFSDTTYRIAREHRDKQNIQLLHYDNLYDFACEAPSFPTY